MNKLAKLIRKLYVKHGVGTIGWCFANFLLVVILTAYGISLYNEFSLIHVTVSMGAFICAMLIVLFALKNSDSDIVVGKSLIYYFALIRLSIYSGLMLIVKAVFWSF